MLEEATVTSGPFAVTATAEYVKVTAGLGAVELLAFCNVTAKVSSSMPAVVTAVALSVSATVVVSVSALAMTQKLIASATTSVSILTFFHTFIK